MLIIITHMKRSVSSTTHIEWDYHMAKTAFQSDAGFRRYKLLKSVMVGPGRSVGRLYVEKSPYPVRTRRCFALARNYNKYAALVTSGPGLWKSWIRPCDRYFTCGVSVLITSECEALASSHWIRGFFHKRPTRPGPTDRTTDHHAFQELISSEPRIQLTSGLRHLIAPFNMCCA